MPDAANDPADPAGPTEDAARAERTRSGPGRLLIAVYALFALAATARSAVQLATKFDEAPLAYLLSAFAAAVYLVATVCLARGDRTSRRVAMVSIVVELVGVLTVGTLSLVDPQAFPDATVWSAYGSGYGFVPLVLPVLGLWWLRWTARKIDTHRS
jgi:cytochrome bd-type quinol oxidase subunit 2